jgi:hypothetical protein
VRESTSKVTYLLRDDEGRRDGSKSPESTSGAYMLEVTYSSYHVCYHWRAEEALQKDDIGLDLKRLDRTHWALT